MKDFLYEILSEIYPKGARKREMFSPSNAEGHKAIAELLAEGRIREELYTDYTNMENYYVYYWKS